MANAPANAPGTRPPGPRRPRSGRRAWAKVFAATARATAIGMLAFQEFTVAVRTASPRRPGSPRGPQGENGERASQAISALQAPACAPGDGGADTAALSRPAAGAGPPRVSGAPPPGHTSLPLRVKGTGDAPARGRGL